MSDISNAVLFIDRFGEELAPLNQFYPPALMPVAGKTPLEYWLELLSELKYKQVFLIVGPFTRQIKAQYPDGDHWGLELVYLDSRGEEHPQALIERYRSTLPNRFMVARGDILPRGEFDQDWCAGHSYSVSDAGPLDLNKLHWPNLKALYPENPLLLGSADQLLKSTELILRGALGQLVPRGLKHRTGRWVATHDLSAEQVDQARGSLYVGRNARVLGDVSLSNGASVEQGSYIDRGASLSNCIVMPGTYVGQNISLNNVIACPPYLIDLKNGSVIQIDDPELIAPIEPAATLVRTSGTERLAAALLMFLTAPLAVPLMLLTTGFNRRRISTQMIHTNGSSRANPRRVEMIRFHCAFGWVNRWPALLNVIEGDLKLFGSPIESIKELPALENLPFCQGVFTAQDLMGKAQMDHLEQQLWGIELANETPGLWKMLKRGVRAILRPEPSLGRSMQ